MRSESFFRVFVCTQTSLKMFFEKEKACISRPSKFLQNFVQFYLPHQAFRGFITHEARQAMGPYGHLFGAGAGLETLPPAGIT
jgi:hypothetical protein